jgi:CcmD family protein
LVCLLLLPLAGAAVGAQGQPTSAAQDEFVPLDSLPPDEGLPAAPLVMAAYGAAWLIIVLYLWSIWRRLGHVERELAEVARRADPTRSTGSHRPADAGSSSAGVSEREGLVTQTPRSGEGG